MSQSWVSAEVCLQVNVDATRATRPNPRRQKTTPAFETVLIDKDPQHPRIAELEAKLAALG
jgi:hypothetical protein